jgi:hypothetical protein
VRYRIRIIGDVLVEAENVMQAHHVAKRIRVFGERSGRRRMAKDRDSIRYEVSVLSTYVSLPRKEQP